MQEHHYVAIMAGGVGSRFWPASRESRPKQFLDITESGRSLLQQTVARVSDIVPLGNILIVSNAKYKNQILEQLPLLDESQLLLEPSRNNTAPCVAYTALHLQAKNENAVFAMLPADHIIQKENVFASCMIRAFNYAGQHDAIVTLGIEPTRPDTGYGYIHYDQIDRGESVHKVHSFREKPDMVTAQKYIDQGGYLWNAGIFVWSVNTILNAFSSSAPDITDVLTADAAKFGTLAEQDYINDVYPNTRDISVDFAILEPAQNVFTIPADIGWSDLGTWNSLYSYLDKDQHDNVVQAGAQQLIDMRGNLIRTSSSDKLVVAKGLQDYIIIDDGDVLLIYPREEEQDIKALRKGLKQEHYK
ncbi:MAG: mannose-1-phosphate guanylyltransferase [Bacteroidota bacterium]